jgi:DNA replication protein DnaC
MKSEVTALQAESELYSDSRLLELMNSVHLKETQDQYKALLQEASESSMSYREFMGRLLEIENEGRCRKRVERLKKAANFEFIKSLSDIDYGFNPSLSKNQIEELGTLDFMSNHENIILIGPPGVGKSMIATGIGLNACKAERKVLFINAQDLVDNLCEEKKKGTLRKYLKRLEKVPLLIIDEMSYLRLDNEKESLFFQVIRGHYEKGSLIITTNIPLGRWGEMFSSEIAATAILDRLLHHCHVISITGESYRVKSG